MKLWKRNTVVLTVLVLVCAAVYLNWSYGQKEEAAAQTGLAAQAAVNEEKTAAAEDTAEPERTEETESTSVTEGGLWYTGTGKTASRSDVQSAYFDTVRLSREQARAQAKETLLTVSGTEEAGQDTVDEALDSISQMAQWTVLESALEGEIMAKGYEDCVVFLTGEGVTVTVPSPAEGLSQAAVARITDIVVEGSDYTASQLRIVEVK